MAWSRPKPCTMPGCASMQPCPTHERKPYRRHDGTRHDSRGNAQSRGYGSDWERVRKAALKRDRFECRRCGGRAVLVHHIVEITGHDDPNRLDLDNCESLCRDCHERHHGRKK